MNGIRKQGIAVTVAVVGLAIVFSQGGPPSAAAAGGVSGKDGCEARSGRGGRAEARVPLLPSYGEVAAVLRLTDEQRAVVEPAMEELTRDMDRFRGRNASRGGNRCGEDGRGEGRRGPQRRTGAAPGEPGRPMHGFLVAVVPALDVEQTEVLADYMAARRDAHREDRPGGEGGEGGGSHGGRGSRGGPGGRGIAAGAGPMAGAGLGGELRRFGSELELDDDQRDAIHAVLDDRRSEFRALHDGFESGALSAEEVRDQSKALRGSIEEELGQILSEEQSIRLAELRTERRAERAEQREERADEHVERRTEFLAAALELDDATSAKVREALERGEGEQRSVRLQLQNGEIEIEDARYQGYVITEKTGERIAAALEGDQARKFEALHRLLPGGGRRGR